MRITEAAFDGQPTAKRSSRPAPGAVATVGAASAASPLSLALIVVGAGALLAPADLPVAGDLLALAAVAVGSFLLGRGPRHASGADQIFRAAALERQTGAIERGEVIRAALALASISGRDDAADRARRSQLVADSVEPEPDGGDDGEARRPDLHAVGNLVRGTGESLELDADADALGGPAR